MKYTINSVLHRLIVTTPVYSNHRLTGQSPYQEPINVIMSPIEGEGDILFLVRILLASALALASASA